MEPFLGQIDFFGFNFPPRGWLLCQGQLLAVAQNDALFSLLGTIYGGDGRTTFALPDLRGRCIVGEGQGIGLSNIPIGARGGSETTILSANNLPAHNHAIAIPVSTEAGEEADPANNYIASRTNGFKSTTNANLNGNAAASTGSTGSGSSFNIRNPYLGLTVAIATTGIYPSRS